jgi:hypothetical protein
MEDCNNKRCKYRCGMMRKMNIRTIASQMRHSQMKKRREVDKDEDREGEQKLEVENFLRNISSEEIC